MNADRPTIHPTVLASIIEAAPGRVRKRLDRQPSTSDAWTWREIDGGFEVAAGEETVQLGMTDGVIQQPEQVACS